MTTKSNLSLIAGGIFLVAAVVGILYAVFAGTMDTVWPWLDFVAFAAAGAGLMMKNRIVSALGLAAVAAARLAYIIYIAVLDIQGVVSGDYAGLPWAFWANIIADYVVFFFALMAFALAALIIFLSTKPSFMTKIWFLPPIFLGLALFSHFLRMIFLIISYNDMSAFAATYFMVCFDDFIVFLFTIAALSFACFWAKKAANEGVSNQAA